MSETKSVATGGVAPPSSKLPPLVNSVLSSDGSTTGGILCTDQSGLLISSEGDIDSKNAGVYANLVKLASRLPKDEAADASSTMVSIECNSATTLVKQYEGYTVAIRKKTATKAEDSENGL